MFWKQTQILRTCQSTQDKNYREKWSCPVHAMKTNKGAIVPPILNLGARWEWSSWSGRFITGQVRRCPLKEWLCGSQSQSGDETIADRDPNSGPPSHTDYATPVPIHNGISRDLFKMLNRTWTLYSKPILHLLTIQLLVSSQCPSLSWYLYNADNKIPN
jgi:hypothetical protein